MNSENPSSTKEQLRRARRIALVLATSTVISLSCMVFAIVQQKEAERQQQLAQELALKVVESAKQAEQESAIARKSAEVYSAELARTLSECAKTKK